MTTPGEMRNPEVERKIGYPVWPEGKPFPLTPLEAWYVQGWAVNVKPKAGLTLDQALDLPGKIEFGDGYVWLWQS